MNGFALMADSYRKYLQSQGYDKEAGASFCEDSPEVRDAERKVRIFDFLATCDDDDFYTLFDSSAFNEIAKDYFRMALKQAGVDDETRSNVMNELRFLLSEKTAKKICEGSD